MRGIAKPCLFKHSSKDVGLTFHGDDFVAVRNEADLMEVKKVLLNAYRITYEILGPDSGNVREVRILNRIIRWTGGNIRLEADPRHAEKVIAYYNLEGAKGTSSRSQASQEARGQR